MNTEGIIDFHAKIGWSGLSLAVLFMLSAVFYSCDPAITDEKEGTLRGAAENAGLFYNGSVYLANDEYPVLFDEDYIPKPKYFSVYDALK